MVLLAMEELRQEGLLHPDPLQLPPHGISRREMISKVGLTAAAIMPMINAITAPPAAAQSGSVGTGAARSRIIINALRNSKAKPTGQ